MKQPSECLTIEDIRAEIDRIDKQIIELIGQRSSYVRKAADFKKDKTSVKAEDRVKIMLSKRKEWALANELHPEFIENLYKTIVDYFIDEEMKKF